MMLVTKPKVKKRYQHLKENGEEERKIRRELKLGDSAETTIDTTGDRKRVKCYKQGKMTEGNERRRQVRKR